MKCRPAGSADRRRPPPPPPPVRRSRAATARNHIAALPARAVRLVRPMIGPENHREAAIPLTRSPPGRRGVGTVSVSMSVATNPTASISPTRKDTPIRVRSRTRSPSLNTSRSSVLAVERSGISQRAQSPASPAPKQCGQILTPVGVLCIKRECERKPGVAPAIVSRFIRLCQARSGRPERLVDSAR